MSKDGAEDAFVRHSIAWSWTDRSGSKNRIEVWLPDRGGATLEQARQVAIRAGYPGHRGGWWNYMVSDIARCLRPTNPDEKDVK